MNECAGKVSDENTVKLCCTLRPAFDGRLFSELKKRDLLPPWLLETVRELKLVMDLAEEVSVLM